MTTQDQTQTLRIERDFDCTLEQMWAACTDPAQYAKWISPFPGLDAEVHEMDVRVGGRVRFTMVGNDGTRYPETSMVFEVLDKPHTLVLFESNEGRDDIFADHPMRGTMRFSTRGGKTHMVFEQTGLPAAMPLDMARGGFGACFDKLDAHLKTQEKNAMTTKQPLRLERMFDATPEQLWSAWTDPKQYAKWFNPAPGIDLVMHEYDVRPGGKVRFDMPQPNGDPHPQEGMFHVVSPYKQIVSGSPDKSFLVTVTFEPMGKQTRMVIEVVGVPPEYHAMATVGWNAGFDKLAALLKSGRA